MEEQELLAMGDSHEEETQNTVKLRYYSEDEYTDYAQDYED